MIRLPRQADHRSALRNFDFLKTPAVNTIYHGGMLDSQLVLGLVPGAKAQKPLPSCNSVVFEPCRAALGAVPQGQLVLPENH